MSPSASCFAALTLTLIVARAAHAQVSPRFEWKERLVVESNATMTPQLAPFRGTPLPLPPPLVARSIGTGAAPAVDVRPSCAMPVASGDAGTEDSMPVARTDVATLERMPVVSSVCRGTR
jgi:hypothetical protein